MSDPYLSVVVPCYNESENLGRGVLEEMHAYLSRRHDAYEVIISDDGSTDDSRDLIRTHSMPRFRLLSNPHGGKPWAVWHGVRAARGDLVLITDMDQSTPIDQLALLLPYFDQGYDIVIGSRGLARENFPWYRRLGSTVFRGFRRLLVLHSISDTQCGFKCLRRETAMSVFPHLEPIRRPAQVKGWRVTAYDVEMLFLAELLGYSIAEVTVRWANRDVAQGKQKSYVRESWEMAQQILRVQWNSLRGAYRDIPKTE